MIGVHVSKISKVLDAPHKTRKTMLQAIKTDTAQLGLNAVQIFTHGPQNSRQNKMDYPSIVAFCTEHKTNLYVHSSYLTSGIWNITVENKDDAKPKAAINILAAQLESCDKLNARGLILHLPKKEPAVILETLQVVSKLLTSHNTPILLEMTSVKPDSNKTYETPQKINNLTKLILEKFPELDWGWCPDTAHLWGAGIELDDCNVMKKWLKKLKYPKLIKLIHLNGASITTFNTGKDKHKVLFGDEDDIWNSTFTEAQVYDDLGVTQSSISILAAFAKKYKIDCICEVNRGEYSQIDFSIKSLKKIMQD